MKQVNAYVLYELAVALAEVEQAVLPMHSAADAMIATGQADRLLRDFLNGSFVPLRGTAESGLRTAGKDLLDAIKDLRDALEAQEFREGTAALQTQSVEPAERDIHHAINAFVVRMHLDAPRLSLYFVPQRLAYDTRTLLERADRAIPKSLRDLLPPHAHKDLRQAGRCLAFRLPTAVAFHVLRATETVMVSYLGVLDLTVPERPSWATYIKALGTRRDLPPRMIARLDRLKDYERDEIMHPERFLNADEAGDLFDYAKSAITAMLRDIKKRNPGSESPTTQ